MFDKMSVHKSLENFDVGWRDVMTWILRYAVLTW